MLEITSKSNPRLKKILDLRERKYRDEKQLFLIEGYREISRAGNVKIEELYFCRDLFLGENEEALINKIGAFAELISCSKEAFSKISYRDRPDGLLAVAKCFDTSLSKLIKFSKSPFLIVVESVEKPGNLGTILRTADGVNADAVIVADPCTDIFNPNVVRASVGTLFTRPVVIASSGEILDFLKVNKVKIIAASPHAKLEYFKADMKGPIAILLGSEQYGLSSLWLEKSDEKIFLPMLGVADSLNVATAASVLLYEALRQRRS